MKNLIKDFQTKISEIIIQKQNSMNEDKFNSISKISSLKLQSFSNENQYSGSLENTIFFTYSNHYRGNSGIYMEVGTLNHAHVSYEDRGYIKGVATDLTGYLALRGMLVSHNFDVVANIYFPKFKKSKHSEAYRNECNLIVLKALNELNEYKDQMNSNINAELRNLTGCSLLHYIRPI